jgi:hypothetical protein
MWDIASLLLFVLVLTSWLLPAVSSQSVFAMAGITDFSLSTLCSSFTYTDCWSIYSNQLFGLVPYSTLEYSASSSGQAPGGGITVCVSMYLSCSAVTNGDFAGQVASNPQASCLATGAQAQGSKGAYGSGSSFNAFFTSAQANYATGTNIAPVFNMQYYDASGNTNIPQTQTLSGSALVPNCTNGTVWAITTTGCMDNYAYTYDCYVSLIRFAFNLQYGPLAVGSPTPAANINIPIVGTGSGPAVAVVLVGSNTVGVSNIPGGITATTRIIGGVSHTALDSWVANSFTSSVTDPIPMYGAIVGVTQPISGSVGLTGTAPGGSPVSVQTVGSNTVAVTGASLSENITLSPISVVIYQNGTTIDVSLTSISASLAATVLQFVPTFGANPFGYIFGFNGSTDELSDGSTGLPGPGHANSTTGGLGSVTLPQYSSVIGSTGNDPNITATAARAPQTWWGLLLQWF